MKKYKDKGFSLIELIIAIAILVVLTGLLAPQFTKYIERARWAKAVHSLDRIYFALEVAYVEIPQTEKEGNEDDWIDIINGEPYPFENNNAGKAICESMRASLGDDIMDRVDIHISIEDNDNIDDLSKSIIKYRASGKESSDFYYLNKGVDDEDENGGELFPGTFGQYRNNVLVKWQ